MDIQHWNWFQVGENEIEIVYVWSKMITPALHEELCDDIEGGKYFDWLMNQLIWPALNYYALQFAITVKRKARYFVVSLHFYTTTAEVLAFFYQSGLFFEQFGMLPIMPIWQPCSLVAWRHLYCPLSPFREDHQKCLSPPHTHKNYHRMQIH